ncbi:alpha/beta hydrolase [Nocardioides sp. CN2-186]|uniref:alpha/beta hydrolase n=1 Tax=Nocardioides tweenelious TaxID=3156607 RepID=UPI0032B37010
MKRLVVVLLVVAMLLAVGGTAALVALGSGSEQGAPLDAPTTTPEPGATTPPRPALAPFYSQQLTWTQCRTTDLCSTLTVPLDYRHPTGDTIELALLKVPAAHPADRIGSLVVNPGGPGAPGTDYAANADKVFRAPLLDVYDIVGFDPRGTGSSSPVDCLSDGDLDTFLARDPDPDTAAEADDYIAANQAFWRGCAEKSGNLAAHITTIEAARDMDVLRATLGDSQLDYLGASYGTQLGATYADLFPDKVGRLVLDGAIDLSLGTLELGLQQAAGFETALTSYLQHCVDAGSCFLGDTAEAGSARITDFLDQVDGQPLETTLGDRVLTEGIATTGIAFTLYNKSFWPYLTQALQDAFDGDGTLLLRLADSYSSRGQSGYLDNSLEAFPAISCLDDPSAISESEVPAAIARYEAASPTFGRGFAWGATNCGGIQVRATEHDRVIDAKGAAPIVVIGTTRDPATPYDWAVHLAAQLDSGVLVSRDGDGHTAYNEGNACIDSAVEDYLVDGTVPKDGLSC